MVFPYKKRELKILNCYIINLMENKNIEKYDINPYIESFSFFKDNTHLKLKFLNLNSEVQNDKLTEHFYSNYIQELIDNIKLNIQESSEKEKQINIFQTNPKTIFDCFLKELHKIFGGKEIYPTKIKSKELNKENANNIFKKFKDNDKSYISDNFYGVKLIEKKCKECKMTQYIYKYLKTIPIKISDIKDDKILDIEKYLKKIQRKFIKEDICPKCSNKKKLSIKIKILNFPKILILVFYGNTKFKIKNTIKHGEYELIAAEIKNKNIFIDIINYFGLKYKNYKYINKETNKEIEDSLDDEIPVVLFYKRREQMILDDDFGSNSKDSFCTSDKSTENNDTQDIEINNKIEQKKNTSKIKEKNNNTIVKKNITLIFKLSKKEKEKEKDYSIKVLNSQPFSKITQDLRKKYEILDIDKIDLNKIMFKNKQISMNKTPIDYNMKEEDIIMILE